MLAVAGRRSGDRGFRYDMLEVEIRKPFDGFKILRLVCFGSTPGEAQRHLKPDPGGGHFVGGFPNPQDVAFITDENVMPQ